MNEIDEHEAWIQRMMLQGFMVYGEDLLCIFCGCLVANIEIRPTQHATGVHREKCNNGRMG